MFDKPVLKTAFITGEYKKDVSSKFIVLEEAVKANYVNISVMDFIPKDKYNTTDYNDWEFDGKVYCSVRDDIIYDVSSGNAIFYKTGLKDKFPHQYNRMINHKSKDFKVL